MEELEPAFRLAIGVVELRKKTHPGKHIGYSIFWRLAPHAIVFGAELKLSSHSWL